MGSINLTYEIGATDVDLDVLVSELEYGSTFILHPSGREEMISPRTDVFRWIDHYIDDGQLRLIVDHDFLEEEYFFEKLFSAFIYNLQDFGQFRLDSVECSDLSRPSISFHSAATYLRQGPLFGTILKPYYQEREEKVASATEFARCGLDIVKEDETYIVSQKHILEDIKVMSRAVGSDLLYVPNITPYVNDYSFIEQIQEAGTQVAMVNLLLAGLGNIRRLKKRYPDLYLWGHRIGYQSLTPLISMKALAQLCVMAGFDYLHLGTPHDIEGIRNSVSLLDSLIQLNPLFRAVFTKTTAVTARDLAVQFQANAVLMACGYFRAPDGISIDRARLQEWSEVARGYCG